MHVDHLHGGKLLEHAVVPTFGGQLQQTQILRCPKVLESAKLG